MSQVEKNDLILNIVPITLSADHIRVGSIAYESEEAYSDLREQHWRTHAFRFDSRTKRIMNVSLNPQIEPIGTVEMVEVHEHLLLVAKAVQQSILIWLAGGVPIIKAGKKLIFWGQADSARLLTKALEKNNLKPVPGLEVAVRFEVDCRMFFDTKDSPFLGLVMDVGTANIIDIPVRDLLAKGVPLVGSYVCRKREPDLPYLHPGLELLGCVSGVKNSILLLTDTDGIDEIESADAYLEPRLENLQAVIDTIYGPQADNVMTNLKNLRQPLTTALGKLERIRNTLASLKKHNFVMSDGLQITFGDLLQESDELFPVRIATDRPSFLVGAQGRTLSQIPDSGVGKHGPYLYMQHARNAPLVAIVCEASLRGRVEQFLASLRDGFPQEAWKNPGRDNPYHGGLIGKFRLSKVRFEIEEVTGSSAVDYESAIQRLLKRLPESPDLAIVQTRETFKLLRGDSNPYFVSKAKFMRAGVPTQSICIEKIDTTPEQLAYILNNIALAIYAKLDGIPWVITTRGPTAHELVMGIGSVEVSAGRMQPKTRYIGINTVFQGDGRYMVWGMTREAAYEEYTTALLESLKTTISYVRERGNWQPGDRVRLVFHVYKRLKNSEIEAIKELVQDLMTEQYTVEFAFLDVSWSHPYHMFDPGQKGKTYWSSGKARIKGKGVSQRGICLQLDKSRGLLQLTGPSDIKTEEQGVPQPLLVELHSDSTFSDITYLLRQIYHFTYMSWQSFFPASMPVTIKYSQLIARLLGNLNLVTGWDSSVVSIGLLRGRRWFL